MKNEYEIIIETNPYVVALKNKKILLTGGTGLLGSYLVGFIYYLNKNYSYNIELTGLVRNFSKINEEYLNNKNFIWVDSISKCKNTYDYILHFASPTRSKEFITNPASVIDFMYTSTKQLLDIANANKSTFLYLSSSEVYGEISSQDSISENTNSSVDVSNVRSCYPIGKVLSENLCYAYNVQYNTNIRIARLTQILGNNKYDNRFISYLVNCVKNKESIVLNTEGKTSKSFCYIMDALSAIIYILIKGKNESYNVVNDNIKMSIFDMANKVANIYLHENAKIELKSNCGYPNDTMIYLDNNKLCKLGWKPQIGFEDAFKFMIENN